MIRKSSGGYTVYARSGRKMGTYNTKAEANARKAQLEAFKAMRAPAFSPGHRGGRAQHSPSHPTAARVLGDARYEQRHAFRGWNIQPTVLQEHRLFPRVFPELGPADHTHLALVFSDKSDAVQAQHRKWVARSEKKYGRNGPVISGGFHEDWPESVKETIRRLAREYTMLRNAAIAHAKAARLRSIAEHSWSGQPRRHARAAKLGHRKAQRSPLRLGAIQNALAYVHFHEKEQGRVQAARDVIQGHGLSYDEAQILLNAIHVSRDEIERVNASRRAQRSPSEATGWAAKLRALNLHVRRMPGGRWAVFSVRGVTFYNAFGPGPGSREQAINWAWRFAHGHATSPYRIAYRP